VEKYIQYHLLYTIPNLHHASKALAEVPELIVFMGTLITILEVDKQINISTNKTNYNNHERGLYVLYVRILDAAMKIKI